MVKESAKNLSEDDIVFAPQAAEDYDYWAQRDDKILNRINDLIDNILQTPFEGLGKPEPLRFELSGCWSRRINHQHRLVYRVQGGELHILSCRYHYIK